MLPLKKINVFRENICIIYKNEYHRTNEFPLFFRIIFIVFKTNKYFIENIFFLVNSNTSLDRNEARAKIFGHLISMPIHLEYLLVERVEWLFHIIQYVSISYM